MADPKKLTKEEQEIKDLQETRKSHETVIARRQEAIAEIDARLAALQKGGK